MATSSFILTIISLICSLNCATGEDDVVSCHQMYRYRYCENVTHPNASVGAPVQIVVAGYIIGEQVTNGKPTAICSDVSTLIEIEKLLLEVSHKLKKSKLK